MPRGGRAHGIGLLNFPKFLRVCPFGAGWSPPVAFGICVAALGTIMPASHYGGRFSGGRFSDTAPLLSRDRLANAFSRRELQKRGRR
jgi:hypothetical protein